MAKIFLRSKAAPRQSNPGPRLAVVEGTSTKTFLPIGGCIIIFIDSNKCGIGIDH